CAGSRRARQPQSSCLLFARVAAGSCVRDLPVGGRLLRRRSWRRRERRPLSPSASRRRLASPLLPYSRVSLEHRLRAGTAAIGWCTHLVDEATSSVAWTVRQVPAPP